MNPEYMLDTDTVSWALRGLSLVKLPTPFPPDFCASRSCLLGRNRAKFVGSNGSAAAQLNVVN